MKRLQRSAPGVALLCMAALATGCSTDTKMPASDRENFQGGPMPPGFVEKQEGAVPANAPLLRQSGNEEILQKQNDRRWLLLRDNTGLRKAAVMADFLPLSPLEQREHYARLTTVREWEETPYLRGAWQGATWVLTAT